MASPQLENGYTKIAHEIIEHLVTVRMSGTEWQYVMCIIRKTYGWKKKEDWITNSQIVEMTGLSKERVSEAKHRLLRRNIVTEKRNKISIQKDWEKWLELRKSVSRVTEKRNKSYGKAYTQKIKETITKDISDKSQKDMAWKKYDERNHSDDEVIIDADSGEEVVDNTVKETNEKVTALIEWAEKIRGKKFIDTPTQRKMIHDLRTAKFSPQMIKDTFVSLVHSKYWQEQDRLPDFKTVISNLKNKK
jgi:phage replication O-like protein O